MIALGGDSKLTASRSELSPTMSWREICDQPDLARPELMRLSPAERAVAAYLREGYSNREIARALGKSEFTVKHQVASCLTKFGVSRRARFVALLR